MYAEQYFNGQATAAELLGMNPGAGSRAAGESLPLTSAGAGDHSNTPWSPDSPTFWVAAFILLAVLGAAGADARVRLFKGSAGASVGRA